MSTFISTWLLGLKTGVKMMKRVMITLTNKINVRLQFVLSMSRVDFSLLSQLMYIKQKG